MKQLSGEGRRPDGPTGRVQKAGGTKLHPILRPTHHAKEQVKKTPCAFRASVPIFNTAGQEKAILPARPYAAVASRCGEAELVLYGTTDGAAFQKG